MCCGFRRPRRKGKGKLLRVTRVEPSDAANVEADDAVEVVALSSDTVTATAKAKQTRVTCMTLLVRGRSFMRRSLKGCPP